MLKNLKELRKEYEISQQQLADIIGVSQQSINKYENHSIEPDIDTIVKISDYFGVSVDYIIGRTDIKQMLDHYSAEELSTEEQNIIKKYRSANEQEKKIIKFILDN